MSKIDNTHKNSYDYITERLSELKEETNSSKLHAYFNFVQFYGLLDEKNQKRVSDAKKLRLDILKLLIPQASISLIIYQATKGTRAKAYFTYILGASFIPFIYLSYTMSSEENYLLLQAKDDYIKKIEQFKADQMKDPLLLNQNFINEDVCDPDIKFLQNYLKLKLYKEKI
jgi:hypothetical protein